ncbi:MAG: hypothetical protein ACI4GZ_03755 [Ruminococcus sp.]
MFDIRGNRISQADLVVMTFNNQNWRGLNSNAVLMNSIFDRHKPDLVGFQEYRSSSSLGGVLSDEYLLSKWSNLAVADTRIQDVTNTIASGYKLFEPSTTFFSDFVSGRERAYQKAYIEVKGNRIAVFNVHLEESAYHDVQLAQTEEIFNAVSAEESFILLGDFNTKCKSVNDIQYTERMKMFADAGFNCANCSEQFGFTDTWSDGTAAGNGNWYPTENIITSSNIKISKVFIDMQKVEAETGLVIDHLPMIAHLSFA